MRFKAIIFSIFICLIFSNLLAYCGSSGTSANPYQIEDMSDLHELSLISSSSDWDKHFIQTTDINGVLSDNSWVTPAINSIRFYYVVASNESLPVSSRNTNFSAHKTGN